MKKFIDNDDCMGEGTKHFQIFSENLARRFSDYLGDWQTIEEERRKVLSEMEAIHDDYVVGFDLLSSPIEKILFAQLVFTVNGFNRIRCHEAQPAQDIYGGFDNLIRDKCETWVLPQQKFGPYKVDFFFVSALSPEHARKHLIVECDGHDFHEKTKQQASHDKKRDRYLTSLGYPILRFTGSDIYNDVESVATEIEGFLYRQIDADLELMYRGEGK